MIDGAMVDQTIVGGNVPGMMALGVVRKLEE